MAKKDTAKFLSLMNAANDAIVSRGIEEVTQKSVGIDPVRVKREAERHERFGPFRVGENPSKKRLLYRSRDNTTDLS